jgi:hypothetical protein
MAGLPITGYKYNLSTSTDNVTYFTYAASYTNSSWTSGTAFTITGLTNGTYYKVKIKAVNALGEGAESAEIGPFVPNTVPGAPTAVEGTSNANGQSSVSWLAPTDNGGSSISYYTVQYSTNGSSWTTFGTTSASSPLIVDTLTNGTPYYFKVAATNNGTNGGQGPYSAASATATPATVPGVPGAPTLTAGDLTDRFSWTAAANNGSAITAYRFQVSNDDGVTWYSNIGGTLNGEGTTSNLFVDLPTQNRTDSWKLKVKALNGVGLGDYTNKSANATAVWVKGDSNANSYTSQTLTEYEACASTACGSCGLQARRKTRTKEQRKYRWYRSGSTAGAYDADWTDYTSYPDWSTRTCADNGSCVEGSWAATSVGSFVYSGSTYTRFAETNSAGNTTGGYYYFIDQYNDFSYGDGIICGCYEHRTYTGEYCSNSDSYRANNENRCRYYRSTGSCGSGGK